MIGGDMSLLHIVSGKIQTIAGADIGHHNDLIRRKRAADRRMHQQPENDNQ